MSSQHKFEEEFRAIRQTPCKLAEMLFRRGSRRPTCQVQGSDGHPRERGTKLDVPACNLPEAVLMLAQFLQRRPKHKVEPIGGSQEERLCNAKNAIMSNQLPMLVFCGLKMPSPRHKHAGTRDPPPRRCLRSRTRFPCSHKCSDLKETGSTLAHLWWIHSIIISFFAMVSAW
jgi:hypothetical protein